MMGEGDSKGSDSKQLHREHGPKTNAKKWTDKDNNPCVAEANASYKCLHDSNFDRKSCETFFVNYQNCQRFWGTSGFDWKEGLCDVIHKRRPQFDNLKISRERRKHGIKPSLPSPEERAKVLQEVG